VLVGARNEEMDYKQEWLRRLGYWGAQSVISRGDNIGARPYAAEISELLSADRGICAEYVFCVDDVPVVCFVDGKNHEKNIENWINSVRRKIWNQGLVTVVLVIGEKDISAYSILCPKERPQHIAIDDTSAFGPWSAYDFSTSHIQHRLPGWFDPEKKVDRRLLRNLVDTVRELEVEGVNRDASEAIMAQVIFIRYLEQRGIVADRYREKHSVRALHEMIAARAGGEIDNYIMKLGATFNGDFLNDHGAGAPKWKCLSDEVYIHIDRFLQGEEISDGQTSFWGYDFSIIPVELISGIYESFLGNRQKARGAYYTPRHLATLAVEQAFAADPAPHKRSVFDGACGSGILITTAFRKMLAAAEADIGRPLTYSDRVALMRSNIFGSDLDPTACWITAFSLYLCLLDRLSPADVERLQEDEGTKLPPLVIESHGKSSGQNLACGETSGDFFSDENRVIADRKFDVIISNPPWREAGKSKESFEDWIEHNIPDALIPDRQIAAAFTFRASRCCAKNGRIVLILPLNLLIGTESLAFRQCLLADIKVGRIINFADLRHLLFPKAKNACAMLVGMPREQADGPLFEEHELIDYWTPKADMSLAFGRLAVSPDDRTSIQPAQLYNKRSALIHRYWGGGRDVSLLERLSRYGTIASIMERRPGEKWVSNKGFHATDNNNKNYALSDSSWSWLRNAPFLPTREVPEEHPLLTSDIQLKKVGEHFETVATPGGVSGKLYRGNRVIWRNGLGPDLQVRAVFADTPFAFQHTTCALGGVEGDKEVLQLVAAYLRSPLATYFLIMNSYSLIADRSAVSKEEILTLPFIAPEKHPHPETCKIAISKISSIFDVMEGVPELYRGQLYLSKADELHGAVMDYFLLSSRERSLVKETAKYIAPSVQPTTYKKIETPLQSAPDNADIASYTNSLAEAIGHWRSKRGGEGALAVTSVVQRQNKIFGAVKLELCADGYDKNQVIESDDEAKAIIQSLIQASALEISTTDAPVLMPSIVVAVGGVFYLIKPMQRRFWLTRAALADADRMVASIDALASANLGAED
jgi:methylase of polypeptide subunit release factors